MLDKVPYEDSNLLFTILCFVVRISQAIGATAATVASYASATYIFREAAATAMVRFQTLLPLGTKGCYFILCQSKDLKFL